MPPEFLVIPPSHADGTGEQQEVEPPRLLGAAVDPYRGHEQTGGKEDPESTQDFVELSLESNGEGSSDLLRSPAGPDGQRRRNRTDTMIFSEAVNIAEDLARAQTEGEHEESFSLTEISPITEVPEVPLTPEATPSTDDVTTAPSDPPLEFTDHILKDEVEEIPLPALADSEPTVPEDTDEESDEEVVPEEENPDPAATEPPASQEILASQSPSTTATEPSPSEGVSEEKEPEVTDVLEPVQSIPEALELSAKVEVPPTITDEDEDFEDEEESTSPSGPSDLEARDDDEYEDDEDGLPQPANEPEVEP